MGGKKPTDKKVSYYNTFIYKDNNNNYRIITKLVSLKAIVLEENP